GRQRSRLARPVVRRADFDDVRADEVDPAQPAEEAEPLRGREAGHFRGSRTGRERRVEEVDVEREKHRSRPDCLPDQLRIRGASPPAPSGRTPSLSTTVKPSSRAAPMPRAAYPEPRTPAWTDALASSNPSSTARLNVVPWKYL